MLDTRRALSLASSQGQALPEIEELQHLHASGVMLRRGELAMIAGCSGQAKSTLALFMAIKMNVPTLYISADMSQHTALARAASVVTGHAYSSIVEAMGESEAAITYYAEQVAGVHLHWSFASNPTLDAVWLEITAYVEIYDRYPELIVVDNAMDIEVGGEGHEAQMFLTKELHGMARTTGACVLVLHHMRAEDGSKVGFPPARHRIQNKLDQKPGLILSVAIAESGDVYRISPVKVRDGVSYPSGDRWIGVRCDLSRCQFEAASVYPEGSWNV